MILEGRSSHQDIDCIEKLTLGLLQHCRFLLGRDTIYHVKFLRDSSILEHT